MTIVKTDMSTQFSSAMVVFAECSFENEQSLGMVVQTGQNHPVLQTFGPKTSQSFDSSITLPLPTRILDGLVRPVRVIGYDADDAECCAEAAASAVGEMHLTVAVTQTTSWPVGPVGLSAGPALAVCAMSQNARLISQTDTSPTAATTTMTLLMITRAAKPLDRVRYVQVGYTQATPRGGLLHHSDYIMASRSMMIYVQC